MLATWADFDGSNVRPGVEKLARCSNQSKRTVIRHMQELMARQLLERTAAGGRRNGEADTLQLTSPIDLGILGPLLTPDDAR